jgi:hypothetical protein
MAELTEAIGYLAAALALAAFAVKTMLPLRALAVAMSAAFIAYGLLAGIDVLWVTHSLLLPLNAARFYQLWHARSLVMHAAPGELSIEPLLPFMLEVRKPKGTLLFEKGERAEIMYYIARGQVRIVEVDRLCRSGDLIGEIAVFAPEHRRMASARCETDCVLFAMTGKKATELYLESPAFGLHLVRLITSRLIDAIDMQSLPAQQAAAAGGGDAAAAAETLPAAPAGTS